jgi:hypothetical protein
MPVIPELGDQGRRITSLRLHSENYETLFQEKKREKGLPYEYTHHYGLVSKKY